MSKDQFATWLQGYLVMNWTGGYVGSPGMAVRIDAAKMGADVLAAARTVVTTEPANAESKHIFAGAEQIVEICERALASVSDVHETRGRLQTIAKIAKEYAP